MPELHCVAVEDGGSSHVDAGALARAVDLVTATQAPPVLIAVGGGRHLIPEHLEGIADVRRPAEGEVAGAVGIATAPVSARVEHVCPNPREERARVLAQARAAALDRAVHAGADPAAVEVVEVEEVPLAYLADPGLRIVVRAAGPPDVARLRPRGGP
jgi:hypothetical protein